MLVANEVTTTLPRALAKISSNAAMTLVSEPVKPGRSMFVLSEKSASTPCAPEFGEPVEVEVLAVERRLVDLEVARVDDDADRRVDRERRRSRACCASRAGTRSVRSPTVTLSRGRIGVSRSPGVDAVLGQLGLEQRQRHRRAVDRAREALDDVRRRADVILVPVRQDERAVLRRLSARGTRTPG